MITPFQRTFTVGVFTAGLLLAPLLAVSLLSAPAEAAVAKGVSTAVEAGLSGEVVKQAALSGRSGKRVRGGITIEKTADGGHILRLSDDFSLSRVPDPTIGFAKNGRYVDASEFTELASFRGGQAYKIPAGVDPAVFDGLFIWCRQFSVPLAYADLK